MAYALSDETKIVDLGWQPVRSAILPTAGPVADPRGAAPRPLTGCILKC